ncbi:GntR family transcriptional regulator [Paracoccus sp. DMF-8]|uniref:GntR family transcriptional regulator n=1 Tax=Paracoccus aminovorans TaxID=34004 RepID=UPI00078531EF|nr:MULTISPECIES: GntR family transcriptional regulator [Paracoccus]MDF3605263.1 GntR family transcriptional regulator [Paracoccus sp. DMF-8]MDQ7777293.1 GntR family transcriptional regulator [Paracoccus aminovorans]
MTNEQPASLRIEHVPQTLRELAVERLRAAIMSGRFPSGYRLVERTLVDQLGVSRSVIREAIRYLEAEGLVEIQPRQGPIVATLDWDKARQIYDIRLRLEAAAAADCARLLDASARADLQAALQRLKEAFLSDDPQVLYDATTRFYEVIFVTAGHHIAWEIVQRLNGRISRLRALTLASTDRHVSGQARMQRIAEAIFAQDPDRASVAVREHLTEAAEIASKLLHVANEGARRTGQ